MITAQYLHSPNGDLYLGPVLFTSEPMRIGKHDWRIIVFNDPHHGPCTSYEFRRNPQDTWFKHRHWHAYDINDTYLGLPRSLDQLFNRELPQLAQHLPEAAKRYQVIAEAAARQMSLL